MSAHDVVAVAWMYQSSLDEFFNRETFSTAWSLKVGNPFRGETVPLYPQATVDAQQERIDELEAQLFIKQAEPAGDLFERMGLEPVAEFPSIRAWAGNK